MGQACRPASASVARKALQYVVPAMLVCHSWTEPCTFAIRGMVIKQGCAVTSAGKGELSAAYEAFNEMVGVFTPMVWAGLFALFARAPPGSALALLGPGGHFLVAALVRLAARQIVCSIPADALQLDAAEG